MLGLVELGLEAWNFRVRALFWSLVWIWGSVVEERRLTV